MNRLFLYTLLSIVIFGCKSPTSNELNLYTATSTRLVSEAIIDSFNTIIPVKVNLNFSASGTLARQIVSGAPADIFISANRQWIDYLVDKGLVDSTEWCELCTNQLVVISPKERPLAEFSFNSNFNILSSVPDKIAIGDPNTVPAGKYALNVLKQMNWEERLKEKMVWGSDVSAVVRLVEMGECDWGIVYLTEAIRSDKVTISAFVPDSISPPVINYIALIKGSSKDAQKLYHYFTESKSHKELLRFGFTPSSNTLVR